MKLLVDTHLLVWAMLGSSRLPPPAAQLLSAHDLVLSVVSIWEIAIKNALTRSRDPMKVSAIAMIESWESTGRPILPILPRHAAEVERLPQLHGDPFDRLLVAQALSEPLILITHDKRVAAYSDTFILV